MSKLYMLGNAVMLGERRVGFLTRDDADPERIWYVSPRKNEHMFRIWKGWGVAVEIVDFLEKHDVYGIKLVIDGKKRLLSSIPQLRLHGHVEQYEGFEPQIIMAEKHWLGDGQVML